MFKDVAVLDQQMRQQQDVQYHQLLQRARNGTLTQADVDLLNTRVVTELDSQPGLFDASTAVAWIVRTNKFRHAINHVLIKSFARSRGQKRTIYPASHTRWKKAKGARDLDIDKLLEVQDGSDIKGPGLLLYTQNMPVTLEDLSAKPDKLLILEDQRIELAKSTAIAWAQIESSPGF